MASSQEISDKPLKQDVVDFGVYYLDMVECPLDASHKLRRHRLPYHLYKCKKNFPDKVQCPYGHYYYMDKSEMANHLQTCPRKPKVNHAENEIVKQAEETRQRNLTRNYDVDNYQIDEPYWD